MTRHFDHIDLRVPDLSAARDFYLALLPALGFTCDVSNEEWLQFESAGRGPSEFFGVTGDPDFTPNMNRIAFWAESVEQVDRLSRLLHEIGAKKIEGPEYEASYYYAVFFEDPFGNRFEVVHRTKRFEDRS